MQQGVKFHLIKCKKKDLGFTYTIPFLLTKTCTTENHDISMLNKDVFYLLALQAIDGIGDINARKLIEHCGSAQKVFEEKPYVLEKIRGIRPGLSDKLKNKKLFEKAEKELCFAQANQVTIISYLDKDYPLRLRECSDAPLVLFKKGSFALGKKRIISIVGTRMMTPYGRQFLTDFLADLKCYNPIVVSGLAYGIDICAHKEALNNSLTTIGVLAHGFDRIYPRAHGKIALKMMEDGGFYTEFCSGTNPEKMNFVKRNRIVAGISEATIVVESARKGGSLITADLANSYYRDVFAVPGRVKDLYSEGCNMLIKSNKAAMITSVKDLEYILGWKTDERKVKEIQQKMFIELNPDEQLVFNRLKEYEKQVLDALAPACKMSIQKTVSILLQLELKGMVKSLPGKWYQPI
jgi:DNA processing protein